MYSSVEFLPKGSHKNVFLTTSGEKFHSRESLKPKVPQSVTERLIRFKLTEIDPKMDAKCKSNIKESTVTRDHGKK